MHDNHHHEEHGHVYYHTWQDIDEAKPLYLETVISHLGQALAAIVTPDTPAYRAQAAKIAQAVRELDGVELPIYVDSELDPWEPPDENLIILGNLVDNPYLGPLYAQHYVAADRFYPGKGGHVLRTIHDPWGVGLNGILVGGSDIRGVAASAELLVERLELDEEGVVLPQLLEIELGPEVLAKVPDLALEPDQALIDQQMAAARTMLETSAHGGITDPLGRAGFLYYLTGKVGWAEVFKRLAFLMYEDFQSGREQYGGAWGMDADFRLHRMMPAWDLVEEAPIFTDEDRLAITRIYAQFIVDCIPHADAAVRDRKVRHNHTTYAALGLLYAAQYYGKYYDLHQADDWLFVADECFMPQAQGWRPVEDSNGYQWLTLYHMAKYALARPYMEYFESGNLRRGVELALASLDSLGYQASYGDTRDPFGWESEWPLLTLAAWYHGDGRYQWVAEHPGALALPDRRRGDDGRHQRAPAQAKQEPRVMGIGPISGHNAGVEPVEPRDAIGVTKVPMDRRFFLSTGGPEVLPLERSFDKLAFRGGLSTDDEYLLLDGISTGGHRHYDGNSFIRLTALGRIWLADCDYYCSTPNFHNGVLPLRDGLTTGIRPFTESDLVVDLSTTAFTRTAVRDYAGCDWERNVLWRKGRCFLVADVMRARSQGDYDFRALWRVLGEVTTEGSTLTVAQQDRRLDIANADGAALALKVDELTSSNWKPYTYAQPLVRVLQQDRSARLQTGESVTLLNLLRPRLEEDPPAESRRLGAGSVLVRDEAGLAWLGVHLPGEVSTEIGTDAEAWWVGEMGFAFANGSTLQCEDLSVRADRSLSLEVDMQQMEAVVIADYATLLTVDLPAAVGVMVDGVGRPVREVEEGVSFTVPEGRHVITFLCTDDQMSPALSTTLEAMWAQAEAVGPVVGESKKAAQSPAWTVTGGADCTALTTVDTPEGARLLAGDAHGGVRLLTGDGRVLWTTHVDGKVTAVGSADFGGDGLALVVGSGAGLVTALDLQGAALWQFRVPFYKRDGIVRVLLRGDINGDGRDEVIVGAENWHYYALDRRGQFLWKFESVHASTAGAVADVDGDGSLELVAGTEYYWWSGVGADGKQKWQHNTVYGPGAAAVATVPDGSGKRLVAFGCVDGTVQVVRPPREQGPDKRAEVAFVLRTGDRITGLAGGEANLLVASANNSVYAVGVDGGIRWRARLADTPRYLWESNGRVVVLGDGGSLTVLDGEGQVVRAADLGGDVRPASYLAAEGLVVGGRPGGMLQAWKA